MASPYHSISAFGARQDQARVGHVVAQVDVSASAQQPPPVLQRDVRFYGNGIRANNGAVGASLTLDFATLSVSANTAKRQRRD